MERTILLAAMTMGLHDRRDWRVCLGSFTLLRGHGISETKNKNTWFCCVLRRVSERCTIVGQWHNQTPTLGAFCKQRIHSGRVHRADAVLSENDRLALR